MIRSDKTKDQEINDCQKNIESRKYDVCIMSLTFGGLIEDIVKDFLGKGLRVLAISQDSPYDERSTKTSTIESSNHFELIKVKMPRLDKNKSLHKMLMYLIFSKKTAGLAKRINTSAWFAVFPPFFAAYYLLKTCLKKGTPFALILYDLHPDTAIRRGQIGKRNPLAIFLKNQTRFILKNATKVVAIGRDMQQYIMEEYKVLPDRIAFIPNWGHRLPEPDPGETLTYEEENKPFLVLYSGNLGEATDLWSLMKAAKELQRVEENVQFLIVGNGRKEKDLKDYVERELIKNVIFRDFLPQRQYQEVLREASIFVVALRESSKCMSVPSKLYSYLGAGKPVLAIVPKSSEVDIAIGEDGFGISCVNGDIDCIVQGIKTLKNNKDYYNNLSKKALETFHGKYSQGICTEKYFQLLREIQGVV